MKLRNHFITSKLFLRVIASIAGLALILLALFYYLIQHQHHADMEDRYEFKFDMVVRGLNRHIVKHGTVDQETLDEHATMHANHRLILFSPLGKSLFTQQTINKAEADYSLPQFKTANKNSVHIKNNTMTIWRELENDYRLYAQIKMPETTFWDTHRNHTVWWILLCMPFVATLLAIISISFVYQHVYKSWLDILCYTRDIENQQQYQPIKTTAVKELASLETIVNRLSFKHVKQKDSIALLSKTKKELIDALPEIVFRLDRHGKIDYANPHFLHAFSIINNSPEKHNHLPDNLFLNTIVKGVSSEDQLALKHLLDNPKPIRVLVKSIHSSRKYDLWLNPVYPDNKLNESPVASCFVGVLHNVSRDQNELDKLSNMQLEINKRLKANEQLWAVMGHELRTPLNGIIGMIQLLSETELGEEQTDFVKTLKSSSDSMLFLLNDMLDLSKLDAGKMETVVSDMDLLSLSREVCELMAGNAAKKSLEIVFFSDPETPRFVTGDPFRIRQVLLNLMGNAIKFTESGHVALLIEKVVHDHEDIRQRFLGKNTEEQWLRFSISDTGAGIPENEQEKLFKFFNQANDSVSRQFGGTGLGLAISKGLSEMMGGFVTLESSEGEGTTFKVYLPFKVENPSNMYSFPKLRKDLYLLIFDPNPINHHYLSEILGHIGIPAIMFDILATDQLGIMQTKSSKLTPILIIDYEMFNSHDDVKALFDLPNFAVPNKLLMSSRPRRSIPSIIINEFDGFISKPIFMENFIAELLRISEVKDTMLRQTEQNMTLESMLHDIEAAKQTMQLVEHAQTEVPEIPQQNITVLLAEDNKINQKVATKMLEKMGYNIIVAENGEECIEKLNEHPEVKLILMDCRMPKMDGLRATRFIRENKISLPIIALTANDTDDDRRLCEEAGMDDFLPKPINQEKLAKLLKRYQPLLK